LQLKLLGTSHLSSGKPYIIVEDNDGEESLYRQGDTIPNVGRVLEIGRERAIILHNGKRVAIRFPHDDTGEVPAAPIFGGRMRRRGFINNPMMRRRGRVPMGALPPGIRRLSPNRYAIDRGTMDTNMQNPAKLFTEMRAVPNLQNGTSDGFKLSEIQPGSVFQQMGLQDGDVVTSVQGQSVNDPIRAMMLMQQLRNHSSISVRVMRNGTPVSLNYQIQ
jgi:type II secretion system protein C